MACLASALRMHGQAKPVRQGEMQRRQPFVKIWIGALATAAALGSLVFVAGASATRSDTTRPDSSSASRTDPTLRLIAHVKKRTLIIEDSGKVVRQYQIAVGQSKYPTPRGEFLIRRIVWNPSWTPPPNAEWAKNQTPKEPGHPENPMKLVKIFFREPAYYIHGTDQYESLGTAASHGCLRMDPYDAADVAKYLMDHG